MLYIYKCNILYYSTTYYLHYYSWTCVRSQVKDEPKDTSAVVLMPCMETKLSWCKGSDDWDENDNGDSTNGNVVNMDNSPINMQRYVNNIRN